MTRDEFFDCCKQCHFTRDFGITSNPNAMQSHVSVLMIYQEDDKWVWQYNFNRPHYFETDTGCIDDVLKEFKEELIECGFPFQENKI
ncbi:MAG: hypothetical protein J6I68_14270 [Butyrivibrio sp.]|uniref:hypothetical protein n=1 Tax=Butyrivibrio sp. TaxID=28121 RepID=UPI001B687843|nr:hypothetical protein [Butyrivibrio sp.]MBP3784407.1 hypothetical protein [Butyrivibrio sp.]